MNEVIIDKIIRLERVNLLLKSGTIISGRITLYDGENFEMEVGLLEIMENIEQFTLDSTPRNIAIIPLDSIECICYREE